MTAKRSVLGLGMVAAAGLLGAMSYAFACSGQAVLAPLSPSEGARGAEVTISATTWAADPAGYPARDPVKIRWGGVDLAQVNTNGAGSWTTTFTVPDAPPGPYLIVATSYDSRGSVVLTASASFTVTGSAPSTNQPTGTSAGPTTATPAPATSSSPAVAPASSEEQASAPTASPAATAAPAATSAPATPSAPAATSRQAPAAATSPSAAIAPATAVMPISEAQTGRPVRATGTSATAGVSAPASAAPLPSADPAEPALTAAALPDPATFWADPGTTQAARPSLVSEAPAGQGSSGLALALLGIGTLGLFATGLVVAISRRRVAAESSTR